MSIFIDFHILQTVPPSCINRDDTGSPKTAVYGGTERARVSSQAWKHAMRLYFKDEFAADELGSRTKMIPQMLAKEIRDISGYDEAKAAKTAASALGYIGIKIDEKENKNAALFFISRKQLKAIAELAVAEEKDKDKYKKALKDNPAYDILLFGRMVADDPSLNYDAVSQVAHSISTHTVHTEYDYFTAVDDEQSDDNSGAGHLGTVEFNSSTLYRYATINMTELNNELGHDSAKLVKGFAKAFALSMPTGKQTTFASRTVPDMVYVAVRDDQPVNLVGAFEKPVRCSSEGGFAENSCKAFVDYASSVYSSFVDKPIFAICTDRYGISQEIADAVQFKEMLDKLENYVIDFCGRSL